MRSKRPCEESSGVLCEQMKAMKDEDRWCGEKQIRELKQTIRYIQSIELLG